MRCPVAVEAGVEVATGIVVVSAATIMGPCGGGFRHGHGTTLPQLMGPPLNAPLPVGNRLGWEPRSDTEGVPMAFREVSVTQVKEVLRRWLCEAGPAPRGRAPPVKGVGEPRAREPHARFDGRALGTERTDG